MGIEAMTQSLTMQLNAGSQLPTVSDPFERKGEREAIWEKGLLATHLDERVKGMVRGFGESKCANEGVVHEGVGVGEVPEEAARVVKSVGD